MKVWFEKKGPIAGMPINRLERLNACDFTTAERLSNVRITFHAPQATDNQ